MPRKARRRRTCNASSDNWRASGNSIDIDALHFWDLVPYGLLSILHARVITVCKMRGHRGPIWGLSYSYGRGSLVSGGADGKVIEWSWLGRKVVGIREYSVSVDAVALTSNGRLGVAGLHDGRVVVWRTGGGESWVVS